MQARAPETVFTALDDDSVEVRRNIYEALANASTTGPGESAGRWRRKMQEMANWFLQGCVQWVIKRWPLSRFREVVYGPVLVVIVIVTAGPSIGCAVDFFLGAAMLLLPSLSSPPPPSIQARVPWWTLATRQS